MIKRIFSKKSGFTLVEIVVAFAIFAIMASAIMQILNLVSYEKSENAKFMETLEAQEQKLAADGKQQFDKQDGEVILNFKDKKANNISYDMKAANGDKEGVGDGLIYFVSKESQQGGETPVLPGGNGGGDNKGGEQGLLSAVDARITGSQKFDTITFEKIEKATDYTGPGVCYYIQMRAYAPKMTDDDAKYAMFKLNFYSTETVTGTKEYEDTGSKKAYTRDDPQPAYIIDAGYINSDSLGWNNTKSVVLEKNISSGDKSKNPFYVTKTGANTLRISSPYVSDGETVKFNNQTFRFYVVFDKDPHLSFSSFGHNGTSGVFRPCPIYKETYNSNGTCKYEKDGDKTSNYIYGANMYKRNYK